MPKKSDKPSFLRSDDKQWVSSSLFFHCLGKLDISDKVKYLAIDTELTQEETLEYVDHLLDQLTFSDSNNKDEKEARDYIIRVTLILRNWAKEGYHVKLV